MSDLTIDDLAFAICRGGWPESLSMDRNDALDDAKDYIEAICERNAAAVDRSKKDPARVRGITDKTLEVYLRALRKLFIIEDVKARQTSLRSKNGIRISDKRQFVDPSLAVAAIEATPQSILDDFNYFGFLFESLCVRDLRVYSENLRGTIRH